MNKYKILCIGDAHFKERLSYSEYIRDERREEKKEILDTIIRSSNDCEAVVLLGDCLDSKNPAASVIKDFVNFLERFGDKDVFLLSGNHSRKGDGSTALDFLKEITNKPNWHIFTKPTEYNYKEKKLFFLPYMFKSDMGVSTDEELSRVLMKKIPEDNDVIFLHHLISETSTHEGVVGKNNEFFREVILPRKELSKKSKIVIGAHVHQAQSLGNVTVTGSVFTSSAGETNKYIYKIEDNKIIEEIRLPGRHIYKLEDPIPEDLDNYPKKSIMKVVLTKKDIPIEKIKDCMKRFDAHILVEQYKDERKRVDIEGALDFNIENLLGVYAKARGVDLGILVEGFNLIK